MTRSLHCLLLMSVATFQVPGAAPLQTITRLADGVYAAIPAESSGISANSGFIVTRFGVMVIDAQSVKLSSELLEEIRKVTDLPVRYVVHTHHHFQLVEGNSVFADATIVGHRNMRENAVRENRPNVRFPDLTYENKLVFHDGPDRTIEVIHLGRYHTDGDSVVYLPKEKILFAGDLFPQGMGGMNEGYVQEWVAALNKALDMDVETVVPGRRGLRKKDGLVEFRTYLERFIAQVRTFVERGASLEEAVRDITKPPYEPYQEDSDFYKRMWPRNVERVYRELKFGAPGATKAIP